MLPSITTELAAALQARGVPYPVSYGPERLKQSSLSASHIVVERDRDGGDEVVAPPVQANNPRLLFRRDIGARVRVFARSTLPDARGADHERVADKVVDQILLALREIIGERQTAMSVTSSKLLSATDLQEQDLEAWGGVVYELKLTIARGVTDGAYAGESVGVTPAAEATMGGLHGVSVATTLDTSDSPEPTTDLPSASTRIG